MLLGFRETNESCWANQTKFVGTFFFNEKVRIKCIVYFIVQNQNSCSLSLSSSESSDESSLDLNIDRPMRTYE